MPARRPTKPAKKAAAKPEPGRRPRVRVFRNTIDGLWYAERRARNGSLVHKSKGYVKRQRAIDAGESMAEKADLVIEEPAKVS